MTQPRLPCFKLGIRMGSDAFVTEFLERGLLGFYLAVAREGDVAAGDPIIEVGPRRAWLPSDGGRAPLRPRPRRRRGAAPRSGSRRPPESWRDHFARRLSVLAA